MKKFISMMCLLFTFATLFCACNGEEPVETQPVTESVTTTAPTEETTKAPASKLKTYVDIDGELSAKATRLDVMAINAFAGEGGYYKHAQGGCIMGDYLITCMHSPASNNIPEKVCLVKSDLKTGKIVEKSANLILGHANDATYNPDDNVIAVADMGINGNIIHIVDADSLEITGSHTLPTSGTPIGYIAYDEVNKRYVCLGTAIDYIYVYTRDFKLLKVVKCSGLRNSEEYDGKYLGNGAVTDGKYVYIPEWHGGEKWATQNITKENQVKTYLRIIDVSTGKDVDLIELGIQRETEYIGFRNGKFYIGCNNIRWNGMEFYKVEITTTKK